MLVTNSVDPDGSRTTPSGYQPVGIRPATTSVSAAAGCAPPGLRAGAVGCRPTGISAIVSPVPTSTIDTVLPPQFETNAREPAWFNATPYGRWPTGGANRRSPV